jgi:hypothetical protein
MEIIKDAKLEEEDKLILALVDKARFNENILIVLRGDYISVTIFDKADEVKESVSYYTDDETERNKIQLERLKELAK